jgi:inorganic pyrophosphatase
MAIMHQKGNGIIEIPKNTRANTNLIRENVDPRSSDLFLYVLSYNYGFIPQTYCDDNDPLDILVCRKLRWSHVPGGV